jgi:predicted ATPase
MSSARPAGRRVRALAYTLVTTSIVLLFALAEWSTERLVSSHSRIASRTIEIAIVLVATLVFRPIHQRVETAVEAAFYYRKRRALAALEKFRHELTSFTDMGQLLRRVVEAVEHHLEAKACAVYLHRGPYKAERSSFDHAIRELDDSDPLILRLLSSGAPARLKALHSAAPGTLALPMTAAGELVGFVAIDCRNGECDAEETHMLGHLAEDLAVAVVALDPRLRAHRPRATNVPADLTRLFGRDRELHEIERALEDARLVTLTGSGGVGKTRMALECAARAVERYEHGAWFVDLAPLRDGTLVAGAILAAMNVAAGDARTDTSRLIDHLQARSALIVLDNCEHLIADVVAVTREVLQACAHPVIIATSRELLHLADEHVYRLGPLGPKAALELFAERATAVSPGFSLPTHERTVTQICEHLDCIPLAIELAAARVRALSAEDICARLDQRFRLLITGDRTAAPRQQTLAATIEWSYELLTPEEQSLFQRLSTFRGSFSLPAATAVSADNGDCDEFRVLDVLTSLADKSLIAVTLSLSTRYRLLETIRAFAAEKALEMRAVEIAHYRHAAYFSNLAAQAYHQFDTHLPEGWLELLGHDIDNFRAALEWTLEGGGDRQTGAQLTADSSPIFLRMGLLVEGLRWCESARSVPATAPATAGRIEYIASMMYNNLLAFPEALACAERALEYYRRSTDRRGLIRALSQVAQLYARAHRYQEVSVPAEEAIDQARALGEPRLLASVLRRCAFSLPEAEIGRSRTLFQEALDAAGAVDDREEMCHALMWWAARESGGAGFNRAIELSLRALPLANNETKLYLEINIAEYCVAGGRYEEGAPYARRALHSALRVRHPVVTALALALCAPEMSAQNVRDAALVFGYARARLVELNWGGERDDLLTLDRALEIIVSGLEDESITPLLERGSTLREDEALELLFSGSAGSSAADVLPANVAGDRVGTLLR